MFKSTYKWSIQALLSVPLSVIKRKVVEMAKQDDVIFLEEGEISTDSDAEHEIEFPDNATVDEILKAFKIKKTYKVRYRRKTPEWLLYSSIVEIPEDKELEEAMLNHKD